MKSRRIFGASVGLFFAGLVGLAMFIGLSDRLDSPADSPRKWAAEHWKIALEPELLSPGRPSWKKAQAQASLVETKGREQLRIVHQPIDFEGGKFTEWPSQVDSVITGDSVVQLHDGGSIEIESFVMILSGEEPASIPPLPAEKKSIFELISVFELPSFHLEIKTQDTDVIQLRNLGLGCARTQRMHRKLIRSPVYKADEKGRFVFMIDSAPFWHSIEPVIVADVVYDCSEPVPMDFEAYASAKTGDTEVDLVAASEESIFLLHHIETASGAWQMSYSLGEAGFFPSFVPLTDPLQPPERILLDARHKKSGVRQIAKPHFFSPAYKAPMLSYRFETPLEELEGFQVRIAKRVDRVVFRLPRIHSPLEPPEGSHNLFDLRLPAGIAENFRDFEELLGGLTQCRIELIGERSLPSAPVNLGGMTGHELMEFARTEFGRAVHDPDTHTITLGGEPTWFEKTLARGRQLLKDVGLK